MHISNAKDHSFASFRRYFTAHNHSSTPHQIFISRPTHPWETGSHPKHKQFHSSPKNPIGIISRETADFSLEAYYISGHRLGRPNRRLAPSNLEPFHEAAAFLIVVGRLLFSNGLLLHRGICEGSVLRGQRRSRGATSTPLRFISTESER